MFLKTEKNSFNGYFSIYVNKGYKNINAIEIYNAE